MPPSCLQSTGTSFYISESPKENLYLVTCVGFRVKMYHLHYFSHHVSPKSSLQDWWWNIRGDCLSDTKMTMLCSRKTPFPTPSKSEFVVQSQASSLSSVFIKGLIFLNLCQQALTTATLCLSYITPCFVQSNVEMNKHKETVQGWAILTRVLQVLNSQELSNRPLESAESLFICC